jgi:uncharacterized membrane protein YhiD involved in acid resistance
MTNRAPLEAAAVFGGLVIAVVLPVVALAQGGGLPSVAEPSPAGAVLSQLDYLRTALVTLPLATVLGAALAMRPRRRGSPPRTAAVVQTQILLAVIGALVLLVVGASLARAFGVVGVAGLVRYRAKVRDPKDAGVMLATLGVGLASGVGLYVLATFATVFFIGLLWVLESFEPEARKTFVLTMKSKESATLEEQIKNVLRRHHTTFELRTASPDGVSFELRMPVSQKIDVLSKSLMELDPAGTLELEEKKDKSRPDA